MTSSPYGAVPRQDGAHAPSWRDRLAAKQRRRITVPILISEDDGGLHERVEQLRNLLTLMPHVPGSSSEARERVTADLAQARADLAEHVVEVAFVSLPPQEYDALLAAHPATNPADDGGVDWRGALPAMATACCAEEDRPDLEWWTTRLASAEWNKADLLSLWGALLRLNTRAPSARVPFG